MNDHNSITPFTPLVGELAWHVRRGVGTFLTMEFGAPHLRTREPIGPRDISEPRVVRRLKNRLVHIVGDWHLWIQHAEWKLRTSHGQLNSNDDIGTTADAVLSDLDGQKLIAAKTLADGTRWHLMFDLGGELEIWPASYESDASDELWGLYSWQSEIVICQQNGMLKRELSAQQSR